MRAHACPSELGGVSGRLDDVGEENGGEHAIGLGRGTRAREQLLDLADDDIRVLGPDRVI
jgi:hypothetical protein